MSTRNTTTPPNNNKVSPTNTFTEHVEVPQDSQENSFDSALSTKNFKSHFKNKDKFTAYSHANPAQPSDTYDFFGDEAPAPNSKASVKATSGHYNYHHRDLDPERRVESDDGHVELTSDDGLISDSSSEIEPCIPQTARCCPPGKSSLTCSHLIDCCSREIANICHKMADKSKYQACITTEEDGKTTAIDFSGTIEVREPCSKRPTQRKQCSKKPDHNKCRHKRHHCKPKCNPCAPVCPPKCPDPKPEPQPEPPKTDVNDYAFVTWWVTDAQQAISFYYTRFGFRPFAYKGLETGEKDVATYVIKKDKIIMVFQSPLRLKASGPENEKLVNQIHEHIATHGDAIRDIAFIVDNVQALYDKATEAGAESVYGPQTFKDDHGKVVMATIKTRSDVTHTLLNRSKYPDHLFLPTYKPLNDDLPLLDTLLGSSELKEIDHAVINYDWNQMNEACDYYEKNLGFHKFWSVDESVIHTEFSALRSTVMSSSNERVKMPVNEPAEAKYHGQIEEFVEFNHGPGVQHLALSTDNILETVKNLKNRGVEFITAPDAYYDEIKARLSNSPVDVTEDLKKIQELNILVDFDDKGYLLQIFTKPLVTRPTFFIEIIQRRSHNGFGAGNFKSLFESIEKDQQLRGTLNK